jgi:hypothetical protein
MAMPRDLEILSTRAFDHIEQRPECLLLTQSGYARPSVHPGPNAEDTYRADHSIGMGVARRRVFESGAHAGIPNYDAWSFNPIAIAPSSGE